MGEERGEVVAVEDADALGVPAWLLAGFEGSDRVVGDPAPPDGVAADEAEGGERDHGRRRRERALIRLRPGGNSVWGEIAELHLPDRLWRGVGGLLDVEAHDPLVPIAG